MQNAHPYTEAKPSFKQVPFFASYDIGSGNYPLNNVVSASITYNYNADSFASITIEKSDFTGANTDIHGNVVYDLLISGIDDSGEERIVSINIGPASFTGTIQGIS